MLSSLKWGYFSGEFFYVGCSTVYLGRSPHVASGIATTVERETLGLLRALFALPESFEGAFVSGATQANFVALATARQWAAARLGIDASDQGLWNIPPVAVLGRSPHASILKALSMLGMC